MRTLSALKESNFEGIPQECRASLEYIEKMAALSQTPIETWDIPSVFGDGAGGILIDKKLINKKLFEMSESTPTQNPTFTALDQEIFSGINTAFAERWKTTVAMERQQMESDLRQYRNSHAETETYRKRYLQRVVSLRKFSPQDTQFTEHIVRDIVNTNLWTFGGTDENSLVFITRQAIVLTEKNTARGIDLHVPMGTYKVRLSIVGTPFVNVFPHENNIECRGGIYHCYVDSDGEICWGDSGPEASRLLGTQKYTEYMTLLSNLLSAYVPGTYPYRHVFNFQIAHNKTLPIEQRRDIGDICYECENSLPNCKCVECEWCDYEHASDICPDHSCQRCGTLTATPARHCCTECRRVRVASPVNSRVCVCYRHNCCQEILNHPHSSTCTHEEIAIEDDVLSDDEDMDITF